MAVIQADDEAKGEPAAGEPADRAVQPIRCATQPEDVIADEDRRLGPVNMMAIEQFDELETRHTFPTSQREDLLDSIAQTGEAIRHRQDHPRAVREAFHSINALVVHDAVWRRP